MDKPGAKADEGAAEPISGGLSGPFIRRPIATSLLMAGLLLIGIAAYPFLPVAPLPQVDFPTIQVQAQLPGASPETMASSVAQPLERQFAQMPGVAQITSTSSLGSTNVTVQFELDRNIDAGAQDIQAAINAAGGQLPKNLPNPPLYRKINPSDPPILVIAVSSKTLPITEVDDQADTKVAQQLSQISGVGQINIGGEQKPAVRIQLDPAKVAAKGLTLDDVRAKIAVSTVDAPKGNIDGPTRAFTIYSNDQILKAEPWNDVIVAYRNGAPIRIGDLGQAVDGPEDAKKAAWANGERAVLLIVFKQPGANVIDVVDRVQQELPRLRAAIPPSIDIEILSDRTQTIRASVFDVEITLLITIALVVAVIFLFLRNLWATVIPGATVPLALFGTAALMYVAGFSLDNLSLMALTIAVGFVVDDAIVVLENIVRHIEDGMKPMDAALKGAGEIGFTILSISLSLVAVFIPLLLMGGVVGRLFREFAIVVTMMIALSAVIALTLTPMMAARFLKPESEAEHGRLYKLTERGFERMLRGYERMLDLVLRHQVVTLLVFVGTIGATVWLFVAIPKGFFPQQDTGLIQGTSESSQDVSFAQMSRYQLAFSDILRKDPAIASVSMSVGAGGGATSTNTGRFFITLKPLGERDASASEVIARLRPQIARVQGANLFLQAAQDINIGGRASRTQYQYTLQDADIATLNAWAPKVFEKLRGLPELADVATDQQVNGTTLSLEIDRDQASRFGLDPQAIDDTLYSAFGQRQVAQYFTQLNTYRVIIEILPEIQGETESLNRIYVRAADGGMVPLSAVAKWTTRPVKPLSVAHQGQFPAVTISFNLAPGVSLGEATAAIQRAEGEIGKPASLVGSFQGNAQAFQDSVRSTPYLIVAALLVIYIILGVLYESYVHPLTILSTLPSAGLGALATLMLFGFDFSLIALIGVILLIGIVKKNGIMLVDFAIEAERHHGKSPEAAIREACLLRFRPIMMTTAAAILGGVPLMVGHGTGAEIRQPLGFAMVGGLIVSQALTLFTTPVVYLWLDRLQARLSGQAAAGQTVAEREPDARANLPVAAE